MAQISRLPTELIVAILSYLGADDDRSLPNNTKVDRTLLACTGVSHRFRCLVEPLIYRKISVDLYWDDALEGATQPLRLVTRTLASRPDLAAVVRDLGVYYLGDVWNAPKHTEEDDKLGLDSQEVADALLRLRGTEKRDDYRSILEHSTHLPIPNKLLVCGEPTGLLITLLHHLSKLHTLEIIADDAVENVAYAALGGYGGAVPAGLLSLTKLVLKADNLGYYFAGPTVVPFFALPALQTFHVTDYGPVDDDDDRAEAWLRTGNSSDNLESSASHVSSTFFRSSDRCFFLRPRTSPITRLFLDESEISLKHLERLLNLPIALHELSIPVGDTDSVATRHLVRSLLNHKDSLQSLVLYDPRGEIFDPDLLLLGSIKDLWSLQHLSLPPKLLFDFDHSEGTDPAFLGTLLPPSLVTLELQLVMSHRSLNDILQAMGLPRSLTQTSKEFPSLKKMHFSGVRRDDDDVAREAKEQMTGIGTGIELVFTLADRS